MELRIGLEQFTRRCKTGVARTLRPLAASVVALAVILGGFSVALGAPAVVPPAGTASAVLLQGGVSPLVAKGKASLVRPADPNRVLTLAFVLRPRNFAQLTALAVAGKRVTPSEFQARFAPSVYAAQAVRAFASGSGLRVVRQSPGVTLVEGTVAQVERALKVQINVYRYGGRTFYANANPPVLPASFGSDVVGVVGLTDVPFQKLYVKPAGTDLGATGFFTPDAIRAAYGLTVAYGNGVDGSGRSIAIVMSGDFNSADVQTFSETFGIPYDQTKIQKVQATGVRPTGLDFESTLDVEWAHAIAPGATITEYESGDMDEANLITALDAAIRAQPDVVSMSFGAPETFAPPSDLESWHAELVTAVARGTTPVVASGDWGAFAPDYGFPTVSMPADDPLVVAVGGTSLTLNADNTRADEVAWGEAALQTWRPGITLGSGGGCSLVYTDPATVQESASVCPDGARGLPDVSMVAEYLDTYMTGSGWTLASGTSFAAPMWAGILALAAQRANSPLGWAREAVNAVATESSSSPAFRDITSGDNGLYTAQAGWDAVTGWGSPAGGWALVQALASAGSVTAPTGPVLEGVVGSGCEPSSPDSYCFTFDLTPNRVAYKGVGQVDLIGSGFGSTLGTVTLAAYAGTSFQVPILGWTDTDISVDLDGLFTSSPHPTAAGTYTVTVSTAGGAKSNPVTVKLSDYFWVANSGPTPVTLGPNSPVYQSVYIQVYGPDGSPDRNVRGLAMLYVQPPQGSQPDLVVKEGGQAIDNIGSQWGEYIYPITITGGSAVVEVSSTVSAQGPQPYGSYAYFVDGTEMGISEGFGTWAEFMPGQATHLGSPDLAVTPWTYEPAGQANPVLVQLLDDGGNLVQASDTVMVSLAGEVSGTVYANGSIVHDPTTGTTYTVPVSLSAGEAILQVQDDVPETVILSVYDTSNTGVSPVSIPLTFTAAVAPSVQLSSPVPADGLTCQMVTVSGVDSRAQSVAFPGSAYLRIQPSNWPAPFAVSVNGTPLSQSPDGSYPLDLSSGSETLCVTTTVAQSVTYTAGLFFGSGASEQTASGSFVAGPEASLSAVPMFPHMATSPTSFARYDPVSIVAQDVYQNVYASTDKATVTETSGPNVSVAVYRAGTYQVLQPSGDSWTVTLDPSAPTALYVTSAVPGVATFTVTDITNSAVKPATFQVSFVNSVATHLALRPSSARVDPGTPQTLTVTVADQNGQAVINNSDQVALTVGSHAGKLSVTDAQGHPLTADSQGRYVLRANAGVATFKVTDDTSEALSYAVQDLTQSLVQPDSASGLFSFAAAKLAVTAPASAVAGGQQELTVRAVDSNGNLVSQDSDEVALAIGSHSGTVSVSVQTPTGAVPVQPNPAGQYVARLSGGQLTFEMSDSVAERLTYTFTDLTNPTVQGATVQGEFTAPPSTPVGGGAPAPSQPSTQAPSANQPTVQTDTHVEETVDVSTGNVTVQTADKSIAVGVPQGAFALPVKLTVTQTSSAPAAPAGTVQVSPAWEISTGGASPSKPVTVTFKVSALPAGTSPKQLAVYTEEGGTWKFVAMARPGSTADTVEVRLPHLSVWAVMAVTTKFPDVPDSHWAFSYVEELVARQVVTGYPDGMFGLDRSVTRAEFVKMLDLALGLRPETLSQQPFRDVSGAEWYAPYLDAAYQAGFVKGDAAGNMHPNDPITRQEAAVILARVLGPNVMSKGPVNAFTDSGAIAPWAAGAIRTVVSAGVMQGYPDGTFAPLGNLKRDESAAIVVRTLQFRGGSST